MTISGQAKPLVRRQSGVTTLLPSEVVLDAGEADRIPW